MLAKPLPHEPLEKLYMLAIHNRWQEFREEKKALLEQTFEHGESENKIICFDQRLAASSIGKDTPFYTCLLSEDIEDKILDAVKNADSKLFLVAKEQMTAKALDNGNLTTMRNTASKHAIYAIRKSHLNIQEMFSDLYNEAIDDNNKKLISKYDNFACTLRNSCAIHLDIPFI